MSVTHSPRLSDTELVIPARLAHRTAGGRRIVVTGLLVVLALVALGALLLWPRSGPGTYRTAPVVRRTIVQAVEAEGHLDVWSRVDVNPPEPGLLVRIAVKEGDTVKRGDVLAELDRAAADASLRGARASRGAVASHIAEARATLDAAVDARKRTEKLAQRGLASDAEVVDARSKESKASATLRGAIADLDAANQSVTTAELGHEARTLNATMDGVVLVAPRWTGAVVSPEHGPLFVLGSDLGVLRIDAPVHEADIGLVRPGQHAEYTVPAYPGRTFHAEVVSRSIEPETSNAGTSYRVTLRTENPDHVLLPGMSATLRLESARAEDAVAVREAALRFEPEGAREAAPRSRVFRLEGNKIEPVAVSAGVSDAAYTEVTPRTPGALRVGDVVVIGLPTSAASARGGPGITLGKR